MSGRTLKVIETRCDGHFFRSRLEARWATFFKALSIEYVYEPEGFDLGDAGWYLPDFWLPDQDSWVEIKPEHPSQAEESKASALATSSCKRVFIFFNRMIAPDVNTNWYKNDSALMFHPEGGADLHWLWCECPFCGSVGIEFDGRSDRLPCKGCATCFYRPGRCETHLDNPSRTCDRIDGDKGYNSGSRRIVDAYNKARNARFEFGSRS